MKKEFPSYYPANSYLTNQKQYTKKLWKNPGYGQTLKYHPENENVNNNKENRILNFILFNPPFSVNLKTKSGNYFRNLIRKHFPSGHKFFKIFQS